MIEVAKVIYRAWGNKSFRDVYTRSVLVLTLHGLGCCIKFPMVGKEEQLTQIKNEEKNWHAAYGPKSARVATLCCRPALIMRYLHPLELKGDGTLAQEDQSAVKTAIEKFAAKGLTNNDLALRHVGLLSPSRKNRKSKGEENDVADKPYVG